MKQRNKQTNKIPKKKNQQKNYKNKNKAKKIENLKTKNQQKKNISVYNNFVGIRNFALNLLRMLVEWLILEILTILLKKKTIFNTYHFNTLQ